jgi:hypothetical protein
LDVTQNPFPQAVTPFQLQIGMVTISSLEVGMELLGMDFAKLGNTN